MTISKKYRLNITDSVSHNMQFMFDNTSKVKEFMKHYYQSSSMTAELWEVVYDWDMSTGAITSTQTKITQL